MSLTLFFIYLTIKNTNKKSLWTLIPISASLFCPIFIVGYWVFATNIWLFPALCISIIVYLFSRQKLSWPIFSIGISLAIFSTFFNLIGTVVWVTGLFFIRKNHNNKFHNVKFIIPWIGGILFSGFTILSFTGTSSQISFSKLLSIDALGFFFAYLSTSYRFGVDNIILSHIVGCATIIIVSYFLYYFFKSKNNFDSNIFPWFLLIFVSIIAGIVITLGRVDLGHDGTQSFYKTISVFSQIGIIVLISIIMTNLNKNKLKTNYYKFKIGILLSIIILQMIFLIPSYYAGWEKAEYYYAQKLLNQNCYSLSHGNECLTASAPGLTAPYERGVLDIFNFWLENNYSFFSDKNFNKQNTNDMLEFQDFLNSSPTKITTSGKIEKLNNQKIITETINITSTKKSKKRKVHFSDSEEDSDNDQKVCLLHGKCAHTTEQCEDLKRLIREHRASRKLEKQGRFSSKKKNSYRKSTYDKKSSKKQKHEVNALVEKKLKKLLKKNRATLNELQHFDQIKLSDSDQKADTSSSSSSSEDGEMSE